MYLFLEVRNVFRQPSASVVRFCIDNCKKDLNANMNEKSTFLWIIFTDEGEKVKLKK